jgi:hypothetical protein
MKLRLSRWFRYIFFQTTDITVGIDYYALESWLKRKQTPDPPRIWTVVAVFKNDWGTLFVRVRNDGGTLYTYRIKKFNSLFVKKSR